MFCESYSLHRIIQRKTSVVLDLHNYSGNLSKVASGMIKFATILYVGVTTYTSCYSLHIADAASWKPLWCWGSDMTVEYMSAKEHIRLLISKQDHYVKFDVSYKYVLTFVLAGLRIWGVETLHPWVFYKLVLSKY